MVKIGVKGITLVALVVTIVVLLILAAVSLNLILGENGLINKAKMASEKSEYASVKEAVDMEIATANMEYTNKKGTVHLLMKKGILDQDCILDIETIVGRKMKTGNGNIISEDTYQDCYVIEGNLLCYYDIEGKIKYKEAVDIQEGIQEPFITEWTTTTENEEIILPLSDPKEKYIFNFEVDYGDGTIVHVNGAKDENRKHIYKTPGTYTVRIKGTCTTFEFHDVPESKDNLTRIVKWGETKLRKVNFEACTNLTGTIPPPDEDTFLYTHTVSTLFTDCINLEGTIPTNLFDRGFAIRSYYAAFDGCSKLTGTIPENLFANSRYVEDFAQVFKKCKGLTGTIPENLFANQTLVNTFSGTFEDTNLEGPIPAKLFQDKPNAERYDRVFLECRNLKSTIPEELFESSPKVTTFEYAFKYCKSLEGDIPENLFADKEYVTNYHDVFYYCEKLTGTIPENLFAKVNPKKQVTNFSGVFKDCKGLTGNIPANLFTNSTKGASKVTRYDTAFYGCSNLTGNIPAELFKGQTEVISYRCVFYNCPNLEGEFPITLFDDSPKVTDFSQAFQYNKKLTGNAPSLWTRTTPEINSNRCFNDCTGLANYNSIPAEWK